MSRPGSGRRDRSSNRNENPDYRIHRSRSHSAVRVEIVEPHEEFDQLPDISPPPRIYVHAPTDPPYIPPLPPAQPRVTNIHGRDARYPSRDDYHDSRRRSQRRSSSHTNGEWEKSHGYVASPENDHSGRMPSIQQNYRPSQPRPDTHTTFTHMPEMVFSTGEHKPARASRRRSDRISKIPVGNVGGGGDGGDIQTSAVKPAEPEPDTLNKIMICVYRNSKRRFVQKEIWMMRPGRRESTFVETSEYLRKDAAFFNALRTDTAFFKEIKWRYKHQLRGTFRQYLSFKTVSTVRVLAVSFFTRHIGV
jgi:hypothetical protein